MFGRKVWAFPQSLRRGRASGLWAAAGVLLGQGGLAAAPILSKALLTAAPIAGNVMLTAAPVSSKAMTPAAPVPGTVVTTAVTASYGLPDGTNEDSASNAASFIVNRTGGVAVLPTADTRQAAPGANTCAFPLQIQNTGGGGDQFSADIAVPDGGSAILVQDDNGDGVYQNTETTKVTLPLTLGAGQSVRCFLRVAYPTPVDKNETASVRLVSRADPSQSAVFRGTLAFAPANAASLAPAWSVQTGGAVLGEATLHGGIAYVGSDDGALYAIAATPEAGAAPGTVLWRRQTNGRVRCTPAIYQTLTGRVQVTAGNDAGRLTTWDAASGQPLWSVSVGVARLASWRARPLVSPDGSLVTVPTGSDSLASFTTMQGLLRRRAPCRDTALAGSPTPFDADGGAWLMGASGWGSWVRNGLPLRRVNLGGPAAGSLALDTGQNCLLGVTTSGHVAAFDALSLAPCLRWPVGGAMGLNVSVMASPALDAANGLLYVAAADHAVYAVHTADGTMGVPGWPFAPSAPAGSTFRAAPLLWPSQDGGAPTLYVGDTGGGFYAVPTDRPDQAVQFTPDRDAAALGEWDAAPAASGTGPQDVVVAGNSNGIVYGFRLR